MSNELLEPAIALHRQGRLAEALAIYETVLAAHPNDPDALQLAGVAALRLGQGARAIALMEQSLSIRPAQPNVRFNLGNAYLQQDRTADAIAAYELALMLDPGLEHAATALWDTRLRAGSVRTLVVTSSDSGFFPLAKDLILSLRKNAARGPQPFDIAFLDCGCTPEECAWMESAGVQVRHVTDGPALRIPDHPLHTMAQTCRPHLPAYFPGYDVYLWFDADIWIQDPGAIGVFVAQALKKRRGLAAVREIDSGYVTLNRSSAAQAYFTDYHARCATFCRPEIMERLVLVPQFNCGVFAMFRDSPGWGIWADYVGRAMVNGYFRMFEQYAFNAATAELGTFANLPAVYNWISSQCTPFRNAEGVVCKSYFPFEPISVVHLTATSQSYEGIKFLDHYRDRKLMFDPER